VVAADDDPRITDALVEQDFHTAVELLEVHYNLVCLDTGTGVLESAAKGILQLADQIVVVTAPSLESARTASSTLDWLQRNGHADLVQGAVAVVNSVRPRSQVELARVVEHFEARCREVVQIPWDPHLEAGAESSLEQLREPTRHAYLQLAAAVQELTDGRGGCYRPHTRAIVLNAERSINQRVSTLVHELGHALLRLEREEEDPALSYPEEELVVESVAYTVCGGLGVNTSGFARSPTSPPGPRTRSRRPSSRPPRSSTGSPAASNTPSKHTTNTTPPPAMSATTDSKQPKSRTRAGGRWARSLPSQRAAGPPSRQAAAATAAPSRAALSGPGD